MSSREDVDQSGEVMLYIYMRSDEDDDRKSLCVIPKHEGLCSRCGFDIGICDLVRGKVLSSGSVILHSFLLRPGEVD